VIDAYVRVSLVGIEILTVDARIVQGLPELLDSGTSGGAKSKTRSVIEGAEEALGGGDEKQRSARVQYSAG